jgi:WD40 repeat protein
MFGTRKLSIVNCQLSTKMKYFLLIIFPACLFAQKGEPNYYQQNAVIQAPLYDCYTRNLDAGNAARDKGDCVAAVKYYQEALDCADVQGNNPRLAELELLIRQCEKEPAQEANQIAQERAPLTFGMHSSRQYIPSTAFLRYTGDNCFAITRQEADRAFAQRCWDDAAKLYRAAKSCADANQTERSSMNDHIADCRQAAEDELRFREQEAIRLARNAIADNLAADAQNILRQFDRSFAYRLADFANEYIAPDDNPKCVQALLDAWYYKPTVQNQALQVPFCYQLAGNLPASTQICALGKGKNAKIYAFAPQQPILWSWNAQRFEPLEPVTFNELYYYFAAAPDDKTLVFFADKNLMIWRSATQFVKVPVSNLSAWAFNKNGDVLYYYDAGAATIFSINLKDQFGQRKGPAKKINVEKFFTVEAPELQRFELFGNQLWMGFRDRLEIWQQKTSDKSWELEKTVHYARTPNFLLGTHIYPAAQTVVLQGDSTLVFNIAAAFDTVNTLAPTFLLDGQVMASTADAKMTARVVPSTDELPDRLIISSNEQGTTLFGAFLNLNAWPEFPNGAFSNDNRWLFSVSLNGALYAWDLSTRQSDWLTDIETAASLNLSPNGANLVVQTDRQLELRNPNQSGTPKVLMPKMASGSVVCAVSNNWVALCEGHDTLHCVANSGQMIRDFAAQTTTDGAMVVAFSEEDQRIALVEKDNAVVVKSLETGVTVANKKFEENIKSLHFIPGSGEIVVLLQTAQNAGQSPRNTAKLWRYTGAGSNPRVVRLHNYPIQMLCVSQQGDLVAFSDGHDVRIFSIYNLSDELVRINHSKDLEITAIAFREDGEALATGYKDGTIDIWDILQGEVLIKLQAVSQAVDCWVKSMAFLENGKKIRQINSNATIATRDLDPTAIRDQAQSVYRRLLPFTPEQISEYGLENAMNYMGNFERLAASGDWPLIRSFFEYYSLQARRSNNIRRVYEYCERAFILYRKLDKETQVSLRGTMLEMLHDYHWKWLLRGQISEAASVVSQMDKDFDHPPQAQEAAAYTALLKGDIRNATSLFTDWAYWTHNTQFIPYEQNWSALDTLHAKIRQLAEYDLLDAAQKACLCGMFGDLIDLKNICGTESGNLTGLDFDATQKLRWNILRNRHKAALTPNFVKKDKFLQAAYADAKALQRNNSTKFRRDLREAALDLATNYFNWGTFEAASPRSTQFFNQSNALLEPGAAALDTMHLALMADNYRSLGTQNLSKDQLEAAITNFEKGIETLNRWVNITGDAFYQNELGARLHYQLNEQQGIALLLQGKAEAARQAFERAEQVQYYAAPVCIGLTFLLEGSDSGALIALGSLNNELAVGTALFYMDVLAVRFPDKRAEIQQFEQRFKAAVAATKTLDTNNIAYWHAAQHFQKMVNLEQWNTALSWSSQALKAAQQALDGPASYSNKDYWLNEHINQAYYLILSNSRDKQTLTQSITYSEKAQTYVESSYEGYGNRELIKTNLAHAYWLRNGVGDRAKSIQIYRDYLKATPNSDDDHWALLEKDFRDLQRFGVEFTNFDQLIEAIRPPDAE